MADEFIALCNALRKLGATHVKHGAFEANFSGVLQAEKPADKPLKAREVDEAKRIEALRRDELSRV